MKKTTFLSLVAATVLFTACGEETKKAASEATAATTEAVKKDTSDAVEATKVKAAEIATATEEKAVELKAAAEVKVAEAVEVVKEKTADVKAAVASAIVATPVSPAAYAKCQACHGADGKTQALGKSAVIAGQDKAVLIASMNEYKAGTRNVAGMGALMNGQVSSMSDADIEVVAEYLSAIK